jgi:hypothetical protein
MLTNSKTYAIDNISIRAESIVGRTNVEVTEDVFNSVTGEIESIFQTHPPLLERWDARGCRDYIDDCQSTYAIDNNGILHSR